MVVNPETRIGPLLDAHPELETVLVALSPEFKRLQNPLLRKTVARVATVAQAAKIGSLSVPDLVKALRRALGQEVDAGCMHTPPDGAEPEPEWVRTGSPVLRLDADEILARAGTPVGEVVGRLASAQSGDVIVLRAPFFPAPLVDAVRAKGHQVWGRLLDGGAWEVWLRTS
jgi:Domain of unknown function (DUF1858)